MYISYLNMYSLNKQKINKPQSTHEKVYAIISYFFRHSAVFFGIEVSLSFCYFCYFHCPLTF